MATKSHSEDGENSDSSDSSAPKRKKKRHRNYSFKLFRSNNGNAVGEALQRRGNWVEVRNRFIVDKIIVTTQRLHDLCGLHLKISTVQAKSKIVV